MVRIERQCKRLEWNLITATVVLSRAKINDRSMLGHVVLSTGMGPDIIGKNSHCVFLQNIDHICWSSVKTMKNQRKAKKTCERAMQSYAKALKILRESVGI